MSLTTLSMEGVAADRAKRDSIAPWYRLALSIGVSSDGPGGPVAERHVRWAVERGTGVTIVELGALGEFLGSILTLAMLAYLAIQIRQNTAQQKREELVSIQHGQNNVIAQLRDPRVFGAYVRTAGGRGSSIEDRGTSFAWVVQYLNHFQIVHHLYQSGSLDEEQYQLWAGFAVAIVAPVGIRRWWEEEDGRLAFHSEVRKMIDQRLNDPANPPPPVTEMWTQFSPEAWESASRSREP